MPNRAAIGYRHCKETQRMVPDPKHFKVVRNLFDLLLSGRYSVSEIHRIACEDWGYTTPATKMIGGRAMARSQIYRLLTNPVYAGYIRWNGELYPGAHKPVVTKAEFERAQQVLGLAPETRPSERSFAYRGLFTCGACGSTGLKRARKEDSALAMPAHTIR